ncbi:MAG: hypothetical protein IKW77_05970 [Salinivirgaceae bacterium]|nr:hypothetical protein [Salinivirgaceae bacterium]
MREYNFIYAIEHNEVQQYLLGEGKYFIPEREYCNRPLHDIGSAMHDIRLCLANKLIDEQKTYDIIDEHFIKILSSNNSPETLLNVSMYIWAYFVDFVEEKKLTTEWHISDELLSLIRAGYRRYIDDGKRCVVSEEQMKQCELYKTTFKELLETRRRLFKERFNLEI